MTAILGTGALSILTGGVHATLERMKDAAASPVPLPGKPAFAEDERAARLQLLAQRLRDPNGLDRDTLSQIERLTATSNSRRVDAFGLFRGHETFVADTSACWRALALPED